MPVWTNEQIKALCGAATPGPWLSEEHGDVATHEGRRVADFVPYSGDREFIAAARELVPELLERVRWAEKQIDKVIGMLAEECCPPGGPEEDECPEDMDVIGGYLSEKSRQMCLECWLRWFKK